MKKIEFEFPEDAKFFEELFSDQGGLEKFSHLFDLRDQEVKRNEFTMLRKSVFLTARPECTTN